jgi:hypothetical protein
MKLWVDDIRPAPHGYFHAYSVEQAKTIIKMMETCDNNTWSLNDDTYKLELIDIDHDAGDYEYDGGDYIKLLDWLEETKRNYPIRIHSMNPVGVSNMRAIIERNGWIEVK